MVRSGSRIVFLTTDLAYGGAETQLVYLATRLSYRGWSVRVVSMIPPEAYVKELEEAGITVESLNMRRGVPDPRALCKLVAILRRERPLVLTSFMYHANLLGRIAGRIGRVPVVISSIRNENFGGPMRDRLMRLSDWLADATTINSHLAGEAVVQRGVVPATKLRIIPNGLDTDRFTWTPEIRVQVRKALGLQEECFLWLAVGRLEQQKDYPNLLAAFARVARERQNVLLYVAGQGSLREDLENQVRSMGMEGRVKFLGLRRDVPRLLAAADGFVLASAWEGLPNVVMEALAASIPVVATRVGGVPELVLDGKSGFTVPPKDPDALAQAMLRLMALPREIRFRMGQTGRAYVEAHYGLENVVNQWEKLFLECLRGRGIPV